MRKITLAVIAAGAIASAAFLGSSLIGSGGQSAHADGATVVRDFTCGILAADSGLDVFLTTDTKSQQVDAASGNVTLTCHFDIPAGEEPALTMRHRGFNCGTFAGVTTNSRSVTTKGGKVLLVCHIKPDA